MKSRFQPQYVDGTFDKESRSLLESSIETFYSESRDLVILEEWGDDIKYVHFPELESRLLKSIEDWKAKQLEKL